MLEQRFFCSRIFLAQCRNGQEGLNDRFDPYFTKVTSRLSRGVESSRLQVSQKLVSWQTYVR